jgi:hypothetical protein
MPISWLSAPVTGSLLTWCVFIARTAAGMVVSGPMVTGGVVINAPAVRPGCRAREFGGSG